MNPRLKLITIAQPGEKQFYGALVWDGMPFAVCVDAGILRNGTYLCKRDFYNHGGYATFEIQVEGHDRVLFHKGNYPDQSLACVIIAESFEIVGGKPGISDSKHGFDEFMRLTEGLETFWFQVAGR